MVGPLNRNHLSIIDKRLFLNGARFMEVPAVNCLLITSYHTSLHNVQYVVEEMLRASFRMYIIGGVATTLILG